MKIYSLIPEKRKFPFGEMHIISVGESGRNRKEILVPFASSISNLAQLKRTQSNRWKIVPSQDPSHWLARITTGDRYTRNTYGSVFVPDPQSHFVKVIARGKGAFGDAGRIGDFYDFILLVKEGTHLFVRPSGGSKSHSYWLVFKDKVYPLDEETHTIYCDEEGKAFGRLSYNGRYDHPGLTDLMTLIDRDSMSDYPSSREPDSYFDIHHLI